MIDCTRKSLVCAIYAALVVVSVRPHVALAADISTPEFGFATSAATTSLLYIKNTLYITATAYSSTPDQTDSTPFTTSNGKPVYDGLIAANWLPYNTKIRIPDLFGEKIFTVNDRMNARYRTGRLDVWMASRNDARKFGARGVRIQIVETEG